MTREDKNFPPTYSHVQVQSCNMASQELPKDFLLGPGPQIHRATVHFKDTLLPEYEGLYAVILDHVLSPTECRQLIDIAEARTNGAWEPAMINIGNGKQSFNPYARDCGRIIWDDRDLVARILARCQDSVPEIHELRDKSKVTGYGPVKRKETWKLSRLNERMRFLKYEKGHFFAREHSISTSSPETRI